MTIDAAGFQKERIGLHSAADPFRLGVNRARG
jgi:hypothetical protein